MSALRAVVECTAIVVCLMLGVLFLVWAIDVTMPDHPLDISGGFVSSQATP